MLASMIAVCLAAVPQPLRAEVLAPDLPAASFLELTAAAAFETPGLPARAAPEITRLDAGTNGMLVRFADKLCRDRRRSVTDGVVVVREFEAICDAKQEKAERFSVNLWRRSDREDHGFRFARDGSVESYLGVIGKKRSHDVTTERAQRILRQESNFWLTVAASGRFIGPL